MTDEEEVAGYLIRREIEDQDEFWHPENEWVSDPSDAELYDKIEDATKVAEALGAGGTFEVIVEEVFYDDEEEGEEDA